MAAQTNEVGFNVEVMTMTAFPPEQIGFRIAGEFATGIGFTKTFVVEIAGTQGPKGSFVVSVRTAFPVNPFGGVQVVVSEEGFEKTPPTLDVHVAEEAAPPMVPFNESAWFMHRPFGKEPAFAVAS